MEEIISNKFEGLPEHGTVVAVLTDEDMQVFRAIDIHYMALNHNPHVFTREETTRITQDRQAWWERVAKDYGFSYAWPVRLDITTGEIYIDNSK